jgi:2-isopropylmalate synthase
MYREPINGYGERCGNANLCSIIPNLELKLGHQAIGGERLRKLRATARFVSEIANLSLDSRAAFVGDSAFAHKGGVHVSAWNVIRKPTSISTRRSSAIAGACWCPNLSGRANLLAKAREMGMHLDEEARVLAEL